MSKYKIKIACTQRKWDNPELAEVMPVTGCRVTHGFLVEANSIEDAKEQAEVMKQDLYKRYYDPIIESIELVGEE